MGTRADFYIGRGEHATWLGSRAWDGYPEGIPESVLKANDVDQYIEAVEAMASERNDWTTPDMGWPWPWDDSATTDYAYAFDGGKVHSSCFGGGWFDPTVEYDADDEERISKDKATFPDMSERKNVAFGRRSGVILISR